MKKIIIALLLVFFVHNANNAQCDFSKNRRVVVRVDEPASISVSTYKIQLMRLLHPPTVGFTAGTSISYQYCSSSWVVSVTEAFDNIFTAKAALNQWKAKGYVDAFMYLEVSYIESKQTEAPVQLSSEDNNIRPESDTTIVSKPQSYVDEQVKLENNINIDYSDIIFK